MQISLTVPSQNATQAIAISAAAAQSAPLDGNNVVVSSTVDCFITRGQNPAAVAPVAGGAVGGVPLLAGVQYRVTGVQAGERLSFICAAGDSGTAYITQGV